MSDIWNTGMREDFKPDDIVAFARILVYAGYFERQLDIVEYFESPYKWFDEYSCWRKLGSPFPDDASWNEFHATLFSEKELEKCLEE